jgi:hypothetical protein
MIQRHKTCSAMMYLFIDIYLTYCLLIHTTGHSASWEAIRFSASQEIPRILWNPKVNYRIHKYPPPVPVLSQLYPPS